MVECFVFPKTAWPPDLKVLSSLVAALAALSFAGIVCAADTTTKTKTETTTTSPAGEVKVEKKETEKKEVKKKTKKSKKAKKSDRSHVVL